MTLKRTSFSNIFYICDNEGNIFGIREDPGVFQKDYYVGEMVKVTGDIHGYICPGIRTPGIGRITCVHEDNTDHFFTVEMVNGEIGSVKSARLEVIR